MTPHFRTQCLPLDALMQKRENPDTTRVAVGALDTRTRTGTI